MIEDRRPRRGWRSHVNELLRHLQQGPILTLVNLHSLHVTLQVPTLIIPSPAVIDRIPLFLDSEEGKDWIYSRDHMFRELERGSDSYLKQEDLGDFTASMLVSGAEKMGEDHFWRDDDQNKDWITPVVVGYASTFLEGFCLPSILLIRDASRKVIVFSASHFSENASQGEVQFSVTVLTP